MAIYQTKIQNQLVYVYFTKKKKHLKMVLKMIKNINLMLFNTEYICIV